MLALLSPSKTLDERNIAPKLPLSTPRLLKESEELVHQLRALSKQQIAELMNISDKLSEQNLERYKKFSLPFNFNNAKPAIYMFKGDVYEGLQAEKFSATELERAQNSIRIISGLYGVIRPLDLIQPYRLEMGIGLVSKKGKNLYEFWGDKITSIINEDIKKHDHSLVVNIASQEYARAVNPKKLTCRMVEVQFKDASKNGYQTVGILAKRARGRFARFMVKEKINQLVKLKEFKDEGYLFNESISTKNCLVFTREMRGG